jgi:uncharacterized protein YndB with AHSA1/START domain
MSQQTTIVPVRQSVVVQAPIERAFEVFTAGFDRWWPRGHHLRDAELAEAEVEPRAGGRWFERGVDGGECDWGRVLVWEPPHRLVLCWAIGSRFEKPADPTRGSEIEVLFTAESPGSTLVQLEHRGFERHGDDGQAVRDAVSREGGWRSLLQAFAAEAGV